MPVEAAAAQRSISAKEFGTFTIGAFARAARELYEAGLKVLPLGGAEGKAPLLKNWNRWKHGLGRVAIEKLSRSDREMLCIIVTHFTIITLFALARTRVANAC